MAINELIGVTIDKIGLTSMAGTVGIKAAEAAEIIPIASTSWMVEYALIITTCGGILFSIKLLLDITVKIMEIISKAGDK